MSDPTFRLVALVRATKLGNVLAGLQLAGCLIEACNVIVDEPKPVPPAKRPQRPARNFKQPIQLGVSSRARAFLSAAAPGTVVLGAEITRSLVAEGFKQTSASSVVATGLRLSPRFHMEAPGRYRVIEGASDEIVLSKRKEHKRG